MSVTTVDPRNIILSVAGNQISGFTNGTFLEIVSNAPQFTLVVGADGFSTRVKSNDYSGTMTVTLAQSSPSNDVLSTIFNLDKAVNGGIVPILIKDLSGTTLIFSATGWIEQFPDITFSNEITDRAWTFSLTEMDVLIGGSGVAS